MPLFVIYFYGPLKVTLDSATGEVLSVQNRITGMSADFGFAPDYITAAKHYAVLQWSATAEA